MKKIIITITFFLLGAVLSGIYVSYTKNMELVKTLGSYTLNNIGDKLDIINLAKEQNTYSKSIHESSNEQLLKQIMLLRLFNPDIAKYPASEKISYCKLLHYRKSGEFKYNGSDSIRIKLFKVVNEYMDSNEDDVLNNIKKVQKSLGGSGCQVAGRKWSKIYYIIRYWKY